MITAEFIIHLSEKNNTFDSFKKVLIENEAEFSDSFIANLLRIIQHMRPVKTTSDTTDSHTGGQKSELAYKFPGLAIPNEQQKKFEYSDNESEDEKQDKKDKKANDADVVDDIMAELEALAPSKQATDEKQTKLTKRKSRSRDRDHKEIKRTRDHKEETHSRSRKRSNSRSRNRSNRRSRSRSRKRSRSRSRRRRDHSHDRRDSRKDRDD